jgi:anaerobic selenocysteine-containing dehydrogenase
MAAARDSESGVTVRKAVCPHDCWDTCAMLVHVKDGRVVRVTGDPDHPVTRGFLCVKTNRYEERIYHPDRILYPMKRTGPKGSRRFERITWEEALTTVAARLRAVADRWGGEAVLPYSYAGTMGVLGYASMDRRFFHRLGASQLDRTICATAGGEAIFKTIGVKQGPDPEDMADCRLIIIWGLNVHHTNTHQWPIILEAKKRGATLVVIDPFRHETARRADWHLSPRPGTDTALALGMMHVILTEGLEDREYIEQHTTGIEQLAQRALQWPPERAAAVTGIPAADIRRLARLWATTRPAVIRVGYGLQRHTNGGSAVRAVCMLPALTGHWRDRGGGFLLSQSGSYGFHAALLERPDLMPEPRPRTINMIRLGESLTEVSDPPVRALFVYNSNPAAVAPNQTRVIEGLLRDELFTVVHEQIWTDTCDYADIVLPATTQMEQLDLHYSYWHMYVMLNEPAIEPLGEAVSNTELFRRLARVIGFTEPAFADSDEAMVRQALSSGSPYLKGITFERLQREKAIKVERAPAPFAEGGFGTPSGKVEFYSEQLAKQGLDPVIDYVPPAESPDGSPDLYRQYPLHLLSPKAKHFLNSSFANLARLKAAEQEPTIFLNPHDAAARGLADGDWARVFNDRGETVLRVRVGEWSLPGVAVSPSVWWNRFSPGGKGINVLTSDQPADLGGGGTFYTNLVQVEKSDWVPVALGSD